MTDQPDPNLADYYRQAESWADDRAAGSARERRLGWIVAAVLGAVALCEAIALVVLLPLKTSVPYTLLVDKQTGYVQQLQPLERQTIAPDAALVRSFLVQYVIAREGFDIDALKDSYRKVALWSSGEARSQYLAGMQASNPASPLASLPRRALVNVEVRSVNALGPDTYQVRFATIRTDPGGQPRQTGIWAAVIKYRFSGEAMSAADRLVNPLGFQVLRYDRAAELEPVLALPVAVPAPGTAPNLSQAPLPGNLQSAPPQAAPSQPLRLERRPGQ